MFKKFIFALLLAAVSAFAVNASESTFKDVYDSAVKNYNQKKYEDSVKDVDKALSLITNDAEKFQALSCKFDNYNAQRNYADAANIAGDVLKIERLTGTQRNLWLANQIAAYHNCGKFDDCIAVCDQLINSKEPERKEQAYNFKYRSYLRKNDSDKALETVNKLAEYAEGVRHPMYYQAKFLQMTTLSNRKEYDKAVAVIAPEEAEKIPGERKSEYYNTLGNIYKNQKKYSEAASAFEKAGQSDHAVQGGSGWFSLGEVYCAMNKNNEAIAAFVKVYELSGSQQNDKAYAILRCAELFGKNNKPEDAILMLNKIDLITGSSPDFAARGKMLAGKILLEQNKKDDAKKQFDAVVNMKGVSAGLVNQAKAEIEKIK